MSVLSSDRAHGVAPLQWPWAVRSPPVVSSDRTAWKGALLRCWRGTSPVMEQPPLDHHYVVMHLGGAKRVERRCDGPGVSSIAESGSLTLVPAGTAYVWRTEGPIAFAHLYIEPRCLDGVSMHELGGSGASVSLIDRVGCRDPFLEPLFSRMVDEVGASAQPSTLLLDSLHESFVIRLARSHATAMPGRLPQAVALAPHRLRRVLEFVDAHFGEDIGLTDLVAAAGSSQYHFSRAFRLATGCSPCRYLMRHRLEYAQVLLIAGDESLEAIGTACGFNSPRQFAVNFKREVGVGPKRFRLVHGRATGGERLSMGRLSGSQFGRA